MRTPILKGAARAGDPTAAMHGDQRRRSFGRFRQIFGGLRQIKVADKLDAIMIGIGDAVFDRNAVRHFLVSCSKPHENRMQWQTGFAVVEQPAKIAK